MGPRIWEPFLTPQDRAHLEHSNHTPVGFGDRPALLLIDLYRWVFGDKPEPILDAIKTWPASCGLAAWNAIPPIQTLLKAARDARIPVIHITGLDQRHSGVEPWTVRRETAPYAVMSKEDRHQRARRWDIIPEVAPLPGEAVIRKSSPSAFWGTPLVGHLNYLDVDTIITCGESTSGCVRATVVDGCTNRYRMMVVEECVFDRHEAAHAINLFDMDQKYADVLPLADVLEQLAVWQAEHY